MEIDNERLIQSIEHTGFVLEHYISECLKANGWQVINNRYYIDDLKNVEREIDIMAYKAIVDDNHVAYYTVLIISCKKASESFWAFLTHQRPEHDPNTEYFLVENHTTDKRLSYMLKTNQEAIKSELSENQDIKTLFEMGHTPFAFQQINARSYKSEDDKRIYDSIITTIKALEYEKENRGRPVIDGVDSYFYNFNLLSVFDGDIVEVFFEGDTEKKIAGTNEIKYINRHIISKKEAFYKVHFITKTAFNLQLELYSSLHRKNSELYPNLIRKFYQDIFLDSGKVDIYWKDFCKELNWHFNYTLIHALGYKSADRVDTFSWDFENNTLKIHFNGFYDIKDSDFLAQVNSQEELKKATEKALLKYFRYSGKFQFDNDYLPF